MVEEINELHVEGMPKVEKLNQAEIVALEFIMVCTYEAEGNDPELILYKMR